MSVQLLLFMVAMAYQLSTAKNPSSGWKSNILAGLGFIVMAATAFIAQNLVTPGEALRTWIAGGVFLLTSAFLLWLGIHRRRLLQQKTDKNNDEVN